MFKDSRGFSMVELLVVVAIIGILSSIAIPSYNRYKQSARVQGYKADLQNLYKAVLAFGAGSDNYCKDSSIDSSGEDFSLDTIGMGSLISGGKYEAVSGTGTGSAGSEGFIGFGADNCTDDITNLVDVLYVSGEASKKDEHCTLDESSFEAGVVGATGEGKNQAWNINQNGSVTETTGNSITSDSACT